MKASIEAAIKHGARRGSITLAKLAEDYETHRATCESIAKLLRLMLEFQRDGTLVDEDMIAVAYAELAKWEAQQ